MGGNWFTDMLGITDSSRDEAMDRYNEQMAASRQVSAEAIERAKKYLQTYYLGGSGLTGGGGTIGGGAGVAGLTPQQLSQAISTAMTAGGGGTAPTGVSGMGAGGYVGANGSIFLNPNNGYMGFNKDLLQPGSVVSYGGQTYTVANGADPSQFYLQPSGTASFDQAKFQAALDQALAAYGGGGGAAAPSAKWGDAGYVSSGGAMGELMEAYNRAMAQLQAGKAEAMTNLTADTTKAQGYIPEYLQKGRDVAESYYMPYRRALDVMTGVAKGTPEETARLLEGSPLYKWQQQQAQTSLDRAMRAKGLGSSRFGMKAQADLTAELAAKEQQRRIEQLMGLYQQGGALGTSMGQAYTGAGAKLSDLGMDYAKNRLGLTTGMATNMAGLDENTGAKRSGLLQDLGQNMAAAEGALGSSQANAYAAGAANSLANAGSSGGGFLDNALKIYQIGSGKWW